MIVVKVTRKKANLAEQRLLRAACATFTPVPIKPRNWGRIGGKKNRQFSDEELTPLPKLDSAAAIADVVERLISDIHKGQLHPKTASALVPLLNLKLRAIESMNHAERLARLEKLHPSDADNEG